MDEVENNKAEKSPESEDSGVEIKAKQQETDNHVVKKNKDNKNKKKDDRSVEVLKALSSLGTSEEKLAAMCKKYADMVDENRKLQAQVKHTEKRVVVIQREKEQLQMEHSKAILARSRLESLCRELQKQNKQIKDESLQRVKEEEERRKAVSNKFQSTLSEITALMQQNNENNSKLRDENLEMQNKFKTLCEQYELREQQVEKMSQQMQLESQLAEAKLTKLKIEMAAEKELLENDKKQLLIELAAYQHKCQELQKTEATLNSQINMYNEKYDKFQEALAKSNQLYSGFKGEIKNMSKKIAKLEKETSIWRSRWENNHQALLQVSAEKQQLTRQLTQLQKLCRTLQGDRTSLLAQLKNEGITPQLPGSRNSAEPVSQELDVKVETQNSATPMTTTATTPCEQEVIKNGNEEEHNDLNEKVCCSSKEEADDKSESNGEELKDEMEAKEKSEIGAGDAREDVKTVDNESDVIGEKCKEKVKGTTKGKKGKESSKKR